MRATYVFLTVLVALGAARPKSPTNSDIETAIKGVLQRCPSCGVEPAFSDFAQAIYLHLAVSEEDNFVFSPLSLHSALSMLYLGTTTNSETEQELAVALGGINNKPAIAGGYRHIIDTYKNETSFSYGNNFWIQDGIDINENFQALVKRNLNSNIANIDFSAPNSPDIVNDWVSRMTAGKIDKLVEEFSGDTAIFLANALYFKEDWAVPFEDTSFSGEPLFGEFLTKSGNLNVSMIQQIISGSGVSFGEIKVFGNETMNVVSIPYKNPLFEMQIFVPAPSRSKTDIELIQLLEAKMMVSDAQDLTSDNANYFNLFSHSRNMTRFGLEYDEVYLRMPIFQASSQLDVVEPLRKLGAEKLFTSGAELGEFTTGNETFAVSKITHKAVVEVTKVGTEGASATGAEIVLLSADFFERKDVIVDSPFIFVVHDKKNNIPVLVGKVMDPTIKVL